MSHIVRWTEDASQGLLRAYRFLAEINEDAATVALKAIHKKALILKRSPYVGRPAADLNPEHRELLVPFGGSGYVLLYKIVEDVIFILAVKHQKEVGYTSWNSLSNN